MMGREPARGRVPSAKIAMIQAILQKTQAARKNTSYGIKQSTPEKSKPMLVITRNTTNTQARLLKGYKK